MLHGFAPGDGYRINEAVKRELAQLFAEQDLPSSLADGGEIDYLDDGAFRDSTRFQSGSNRPSGGSGRV